VLHRVGERLADNEVRGCLEPGGKAPRVHVRDDGHGGPGDERVDARPQPATCERRRQDAVGQFAQLGVRLLGVPERFSHQLARIRCFVRERPERELQHDHRVHETLLRPVV
jgi:hypothetical protein